MKRFVPGIVALIFCLMITVPASAEKKHRVRKVEKGSKVTLSYSVVADEITVESSEEGGPLVFTVGDGKVIPGLEREVIGMQVGEVKEFVLEPDDAYGRPTELIRELPLSSLPPDIKPENNMVMVLNDSESGRKRFITIIEVKEKSVVVDFNHPLAGKTLNFKIEVLSIE